MIINIENNLVFETIEKIKKFIFHIVFTAVGAAILSMYIGFFMPSQMPKVHEQLYQTLCDGNETVNVTQNRFYLPGEVRISNEVTCVDEKGKLRKVNEFISFLVVGFLYPLIFSFILSLLVSLLFFKKEKHAQRH